MTTTCGGSKLAGRAAGAADGPARLGLGQGPGGPGVLGDQGGLLVGCSEVWKSSEVSEAAA